MITVYYMDGFNKMRKSFNVPPEDTLAVERELKDKGYNWYVVDRGTSTYNPEQMTLDFGEIK